MKRLIAPLSVRQKLLAVVLLTTLTALLVAITVMVGFDLRNYRQSLIADMTTQADLLGRTTAPALTFDDSRKAAFLYKFSAFVEWPLRAFAGPESSFTIGVIGADELAAQLEQIVKGRTVLERAVVVRRMRRGESVEGIQMLFIGQAEGARLAEILASAKGQSVLTVTESEDALSHGSMINFVFVDDKVRFDVALPQAERGALRISARLLAVARKVLTSS